MRSVRIQERRRAKNYRYKMEWGGAQKENMDSEENRNIQSRNEEIKVKRELKRIRDGQRRSNICKIAFPLKKKNQNGK